MLVVGCGSSAGKPLAPQPSASPSATADVAPVTNTGTGTVKWKPLRIGAGGYVTGLDIAADGTKVVRCDSAGAFIWSSSASQWVALLSTATMAATEWGHQVDPLTGVYEVAIAPSNTSRIYIIYNGKVFRSDNRGASFAVTGLTKITASANDDFRFLGKKMAVDPHNADVVYVGTQAEGLFFTTDGGANWQKHGAIPAPASASGMRIAFAPNGPVASGRSQRLFVASHGAGVFESNDAGATFSRTPGSPLAAQHMICDKSGTLWLTDGLGGGNLRKYSGGAWSSAGPAGTPFKTIAINPSVPEHIVLGTAGGSIAQSFNAGSTWTDVYNINYPTGSGRRIAKDIPWLAWTNEDYMTSGEMMFDPTGVNKLYFAEGVGVWHSNPPAGFTGFDWTSQSLGIEQLVSNQFVTPPGGTALYMAWDRPVFRLEDPDTAPAKHGPNNKSAIVMGWCADYAPDNANVIVALMNNWGTHQSGYSLDGGLSWTQFASLPSDVAEGKIGGSIAAGDSNNFMILPSNNAGPWYTKDRGATWLRSSVPNVPTSGHTGWGFAYYLHRYALVADKVDRNTFYLYNYLDPYAGVYRSTDGGANFVKVFSGEIAGGSSFNAKMYSVPGQAKHLFFTSGTQDGPSPADTKLMRSIDGGQTWSAVKNVLEAYALGFGKSRTGVGYPAIYLAGYVDGSFGIWRSDDNAANWVNLGSNPLNIADEIKAVSGDINSFGKVYVGFGGSGAAYGTIS